MKKITVKQQVLSAYIIIGILWILSGFLSLFDNFMFTILGLVVAIALLGSVIWVIRTEKEDDDEMSVYNLRKAKATTTDILTRILFLLYICCLLISIFTDIEFKILLKPLLPIFIGVIYVLIGIFFIKYEKDGE